MTTPIGVYNHGFGPPCQSPSLRSSSLPFLFAVRPSSQLQSLLSAATSYSRSALVMTSSKLFRLSAPTTLGRFGLIASSLGLRRVCWPGCKPPATLKLYPLSQAPPLVARFLKTTAAQLTDYFLSRKVRFTAPLDLTPLTPFARKVLTALSHLPYGRTMSYGQLAKRVGAPAAARAVGSVLARNPIPLVIPCHRVLTRTGALGGFSAPAGSNLKQQLLLMESRCPCEQSI